MPVTFIHSKSHLQLLVWKRAQMTPYKLTKSPKFSKLNSQKYQFLEVNVEQPASNSWRGVFCRKFLKNFRLKIKENRTTRKNSSACLTATSRQRNEQVTPVYLVCQDAIRIFGFILFARVLLLKSNYLDDYYIRTNQGISYLKRISLLLDTHLRGYPISSN